MRYLRLLAAVCLLVAVGCAKKDQSRAVNFRGCFVTCSACAGLEMGCVDDAEGLELDTGEEAGEPATGLEMLSK